MMRNLDASLRVILNESRLLRETMEDVEGLVARLQSEVIELRRTLDDRTLSDGRVSPIEFGGTTRREGGAWGTGMRSRSPESTSQGDMPEGSCPGSTYTPPPLSTHVARAGSSREHDARQSDGLQALTPHPDEHVTSDHTPRTFALAPATIWSPALRRGPMPSG